MTTVFKNPYSALETSSTVSEALMLKSTFSASTTFSFVSLITIVFPVEKKLSNCETFRSTESINSSRSYILSSQNYFERNVSSIDSSSLEIVFSPFSLFQNEPQGVYCQAQEYDIFSFHILVEK